MSRTAACLAALALILISCRAALAQGAEDDIRLRATVQDIVSLAKLSGSFRPVDTDPRFALTMRIGSADPATSDLAPGSVVTFGIHSPSRLFGLEDAKAKTWNFILRRHTKNGKAQYAGLELRSNQASTVPASSTRATEP